MPIYFDLDKHSIRKDAAITLDSIVNLLNEYPEVKLELKSYTDSRASDKYNKKLSERRAKSTFKYLVKKGISESITNYSDLLITFKNLFSSSISWLSQIVNLTDCELQDSRNNFSDINEEAILEFKDLFFVTINLLILF